jgi:putative glutamine amidotransferase
MVILSCPVTNGQVRIAVSKTYITYETWIRKAEPSAIIVNMYGLKIDSALKVLDGCSGLLVTGGEDVNPLLYGKGDERSKCEEIDDYRDSLEIALIHRAISKKMPLFGICRGEQVLNVALGGTLFTDIPTDVGRSVIHRSSSSDGSPHLVSIDKKSLLYKITGISRDTVNSYHHQAIDKIAPGFRITAVSDNGVDEAMEPESPDEKSFIMAVQWHPEKSTQNPRLSEPLAEYFIGKIKEFEKRSK